MKLPFKHIAILVILSLTGIFAYQIYWLTGLYRTMKNEMEHNISDAMRICDYHEMMLRVECMRESSDTHGEVSVSAGYSDAESTIRSSTTFQQHGKTKYVMNQHTIPLQDQIKSQTKLIQRNESINIVYPNDSTKVEISIRRDSLLNEKSPPAEGESALSMNRNIDMILKNQRTMLELASYFQRGLHAGLDILMDPDVRVYDSLLSISLKNMNIHLPYRIEYLHSGSTIDSTMIYTDTLAVMGNSTYIPSPKALQFDYPFDLHSNQSYRLWIEPITTIVLKQMSGILITSFIILVILIFSFWYLIHTILKQKTMEEMTGDFTNNITHELKTPIAVAYAANDALLNFNQAEDKNKRDTYLRICQEQLQRLSGLVEQILGMSMERRKAFRLHPEVIELNPLLASLIEQHKLKAGKPVNFVYDIQPENLTVKADRTHFGNIISNLIDNAIKYSPKEASVNIRCSHSSGKTMLVFTDRGIGISADRQKHIFDKFYRVPTGNLHDVKGYGLGLYYVQTMMKQHGGSVNVKSEPGHGSTFTLILNE